MRFYSYILVVVGLLLLASAGYDEISGVTKEPYGKYNLSHKTVVGQFQF